MLKTDSTKATDGASDEAANARGRPASMVNGKRVNVYLDAASLERAAKLGDGNVSEGIRRSLMLPPT
jgi:hypothetical protein